MNYLIGRLCFHAVCFCSLYSFLIWFPFVSDFRFLWFGMECYWINTIHFLFQFDDDSIHQSNWQVASPTIIFRIMVQRKHSINFYCWKTIKSRLNVYSLKVCKVQRLLYRTIDQHHNRTTLRRLVQRRRRIANIIGDISKTNRQTTRQHQQQMIIQNELRLRDIHVPEFVCECDPHVDCCRTMETQTNKWWNFNDAMCRIHLEYFSSDKL